MRRLAALVRWFTDGRNLLALGAAGLVAVFATTVVDSQLARRSSDHRAIAALSALKAQSKAELDRHVADAQRADELTARIGDLTAEVQVLTQQLVAHGITPAHPPSTRPKPTSPPAPTTTTTAPPPAPGPPPPSDPVCSLLQALCSA